MELVAYGVFFAVIAGHFALATLGLNLQWGYTGLFNVGVVGFYAVGAYAFAILTGPEHAEVIGGFGLPTAVGFLGAMAAAGIVALVVAGPTLRLREDYLAITTFGIAVTIQLIAVNADGLTNGVKGIGFIPRPLDGVVTDSLARNVLFLAIVAGMVVVAYVLIERMVRSPWGRVLKAIREDETAAEALGKRAVVFRLQAFVTGSMLMGLSGAVYASFIGFVSPEDFLPILTFQVWAMLIVGGSGNNRGAILGAIAVWALWSLTGAILAELLPSSWAFRAAALQVMLIGALLALVLVLRPRGLIGEEAIVSRDARI